MNKLLNQDELIEILGGQAQYIDKMNMVMREFMDQVKGNKAYLPTKDRIIVKHVIYGIKTFWEDESKNLDGDLSLIMTVDKDPKIKSGYGLRIWRARYVDGKYSDGLFDDYNDVKKMLESDGSNIIIKNDMKNYN